MYGSIQDAEVGRSGQVLWGLLPDDCSIYFPQKKKINKRERDIEKVRLLQDLAWIKVTHPQTVARPCLGEVWQEGRGWSV